MRLLTIGQVATILGVSIAALRKWADAGQIPVTRLPGGHRRWTLDQIDEIKAGMDQPATAKAG